MLTKIVAATLACGLELEWNKGLLALLVTAEIILGILLYIPLFMIAVCVCALFKH